jgi:uncharacterized protein (TIGR03000 family)
MLRFVCFLSVASATAVACNDAKACFRRGRAFCCPPPVISMRPSAGPATIVVRVPAGAKVSFDGCPTTQTSATRVYQTPPLLVGWEYTYTVKVEVGQGAKARSETRKITVRAFCTTQVHVTKPPRGSLRPPLDLPDLPPGLDLNDRP